MTFPASSLSPKSFRRWPALVVLACLLPACATPDDIETKRRRSGTSSSRFEWAVQHYEAGNYEKAIETFERLRKEGPALPEYDLLAFYLGMSQYRMARYEVSARELEGFVRARPAGASDAAGTSRQEARVTLLLGYEKLGRWADAASLAMETDKLTLFQYNRALLKLVWARALREQGELLGAKATLDEAQPFLDKVGTDDGATALYADPDQDLWGRFHYTAVLVQETECQRLGPKELGGAKPEPAKKKAKAEPAKKKAPKKPKRLYPAWLETTADCQRQAVAHAADDLFQRESPWTAPTTQALSQGIAAFGEQLAGYLKDEAGGLDRHRALQRSARENLYRLLGTIEEKLKLFKDRDLAADPLESLRKQIDRLLVQLSAP